MCRSWSRSKTSEVFVNGVLFGLVPDVYQLHPLPLQPFFVPKSERRNVIRRVSPFVVTVTTRCWQSGISSTGCWWAGGVGIGIYLLLP